MSRRKPRLAFDSRGGVVVISRAMLESQAYMTMPAVSKVLMLVLQTQWRNDRPIAFGVREAAAQICCKPDTAGKAFKILEERGFIRCVTESLFNSKTGSKARQWVLCWMPFLDKPPSHEWKQWTP